MKKTALIAFIMAAISPFASAQAAPQKGGVCWGNVPTVAVGDETKFSCPGWGEITIKGIYEKGYRVVAVLPGRGTPGMTYSIVIEEQK